MTNFDVMDCTLQDGGYVNNWQFGKNNILKIMNYLEKANVEYIDIGAYQDNETDADNSFVTSIDKINSYNLNNFLHAIITVRVEWSSCIDNIISKKLPNNVVVRVQFNDFNYEKAIRYCRLLSTKKIPFILHPLQTSYYSLDKFAGLINQIVPLNPFAIYIDDYIGVNDYEILRHYLYILELKLPNNVKIGLKVKKYDSLIPVIQSLNYLHSFLVDGTLCGIGICNVNPKTETICSIINKINNKYDIDQFIPLVDWHLRPVSGSAGPISVLSGIDKYESYDPAYIYVCSKELLLWDYEIKLLLDSTNPRLWFSKDYVNKTLRNIRSNYWNKRLAVVVPTFERPETIEFYLKTSATRLWEYGIDIIIYDSSNTDKTEQLVNKYIEEGYTNIKYYYYDTKDDKSLDYKIIEAYKLLIDDYEYIWICRDGIVITFDYIHIQLEQLIDKKYDLIVVDSDWRDVNGIGQKEYNDCLSLFKDHCIRMVTLGTMIVSSTFVKSLIEEVPVQDSNYSLWQVIGLFQYYSNHPVHAVSYSGKVFVYNPYGLLSSFWNTGGKALWQWAERWYLTVNNLPPVYDEAKDLVYPIEMVDFHPFSYDSLLMIKSNHGLTVHNIHKYKKYLIHVHKRPIWNYYFISLLPIRGKKLKRLLNNKDGRGYKALKKFCSFFGIVE